MSKALIIAEKPSVANDIARALGGFTKHDEYYESDDYVLSSAVGMDRLEGTKLLPGWRPTGRTFPSRSASTP